MIKRLKDTLLCFVFLLSRLSPIQSFAALLMNKYCHLAMEEGVVMMNQQTSRNNRYHIQVFRGGQALQSGISRYISSEELTVYIFGPTKLTHIMMEARHGGIFLETASKCAESQPSRTLLNGTRLLLPETTDGGTSNDKLSVNASAVEIAAVWATSYSGGVKVSDTFLLLPPPETATHRPGRYSDKQEEQEQWGAEKESQEAYVDNNNNNKNTYLEL